MFKPENFNPLIAHIIDEAGNTFQVINAAGDDWDEVATAAQQAAFYASRQGQL
jgi:hypothetical protein